MDTKIPIRLAVIGLGNQAFEHIEAAHQHHDVKIVAGVDQSVICRNKLMQFDAQIAVFEQLEDLLAMQQTLALDGLILALPHHVYAKIWPTILAFKLPLLKEKPLGRDYAEAQHFLQCAEQQGCPLQTAIQRRHHPSYQALYQYIQTHQVHISEVHAHLHLGKGHVQSHEAAPHHVPSLSWRGERQQAGGGALLDAGYHLVDLVQYLVGPFDVVSSTMWAGQQLDDGHSIEDRSLLFGRNEHTWVMLDTWVQGEISPCGHRYQKSEQILLQTNVGVIRADRTGVWHDNQQICQEAQDWQYAMQQQLSEFAFNMRHNQWRDEHFWDQLPAMRVIEEAYRLSSRY
jgi:predicted dehydrogenase